MSQNPVSRDDVVALLRDRSRQSIAVSGVPKLNAEASVRKSETLSTLFRAAEEDGTPDLLCFPNTTVKFADLFPVMRKALGAEMARPEMPQKGGVEARDAAKALHSAAIEGAQDVRNRLSGVLDHLPDGADYRKLIYRGRSVAASRDALAGELVMEISAIVELGNAAPSAISRLLPMMQKALEQLEAAPALSKGIPKTKKELSPGAAECCLALDFLMHEAAAWAAATATKKRYQEILRAVEGRKRRGKGEPSGGGSEGGGSSGGDSGAGSSGGTPSNGGSGHNGPR